MIRTLILLSLLSAFSSGATELETSVQNLSKMSLLDQAATKYQICNETFQKWPSSEYQIRIHQIGALYDKYPEATYGVLSTCQGLWAAKFWDPVRTSAIERQRSSSYFWLHLSSLDLLNAYHTFPEELKLFNSMVPAVNSAVPPAPYEVLSHMASSERQMNVAIEHEVRERYQTVAQSAATVGTLGFMLKNTKAFTVFAGRTSNFIGKVAKPALFISMLAWGAGELTDYGIWQVRHSSLITDLRSLTSLLEKGSELPAPAVLDQFYKAILRLGYFYSFNLYLKDSGSEVPSQIINSHCRGQVAQALDPQLGNAQNLARGFATQTLCQDASLYWLGASSYLSALKPNSPAFQILADRLRQRAKSNYYSQLEIDAYWAEQPVCQEVVHETSLFQRVYECHDPKTGATIL